MRRLPKSEKYIKPVLGLLLLWGAVALFVGGYWAAPARTLPTPARPQISPQATEGQVNANFTGKPYVRGALSELPGFACQGWTNGSHGHGWVVIRCTR